MEKRHTTSPLIHSKNNNPPEEKQILPTPHYSSMISTVSPTPGIAMPASALI